MAVSQDEYTRRVYAILGGPPHDPTSAAAYKAPIDEVDPLLQEYDQLHQVCTGLSRADETQVWKTYEAAGYAPALAAAIGLKAARTAVAAIQRPAITAKQGPDPVEQALDRLRQAAHAAGQLVADDQLVQQIDALAAQLGRMTTPAGRQREVAMKDGTLTPAQRAARSVYPELYAKGAKR